MSDETRAEEVALIRQAAHLVEDDLVSCMYYHNQADLLEHGGELVKHEMFVDLVRTVIRDLGP